MVAASYKDANGHAIASRHRAEYVALCHGFWETVMSFQTYGTITGTQRARRARVFTSSAMVSCHQCQSTFRTSADLNKHYPKCSKSMTGASGSTQNKRKVPPATSTSNDFGSLRAKQPRLKLGLAKKACSGISRSLCQKSNHLK